jgi:hypothetical protein
MTENEVVEIRYKQISKMVDEWLEIHQGERFDLDTICRQLEAVSREARQLIAIKLRNEVVKGKLKKLNNLYRYIDNTITKMDWLNASKASHLDLKYPFGMDESFFGFEEHIMIPEKGIIVIAGVTNTGKSVWCRNFLWVNMEKYHCTYFSSETSAEDFADYASRMDWRNPVNEDGSPKFDLVWRNRDWADVIQPDDINIIDWINMGDNFYQIGTIIEGIKEKLNKGIAVIALQKDPTKDLGTGGMWSEHLSSLYLTMDFGRLTVKKAKKWTKINPNNTMWGFDVVDYGTHFHNIREVKKCYKCYGTGKYKNSECSDCYGKGYINI